MSQLLVLLIVVLVAGAVVALVWVIATHAGKVAQRIDAAWTQGAALVGGEFTPIHGPWYNKKGRTIRAQIGNVPVLADHYTVSTGKSSTTYTRVRSRAAAPPHFALQVYRKHALSGLGEALGFQDVPTGHREFDEGFTIKSNAPELVPVWLGSDVRRALSHVAEYRFTLGGGSLEAKKVGLEQDPHVLAAVVNAVALLAGRGFWLLEAWRKVAAELGGSVRAEHSMWIPGSETSIRTAWRDVPISVDVEMNEEGLLGGDFSLTTRVRGQRSRGERFCMGPGKMPSGFTKVPVQGCPLPVYSQDPDQTLRRLSEDTIQALVKLRPSRIEANDEQVTLLIPGVVVDLQTATDAMQLVGWLASNPQTGPYR